MTNLPKLSDIQIVSLANNLPGPVALARLTKLGVRVTKVEPPWGDPLAHHCSAWYQELTQGQQVLNLNLKQTADRTRFDELLRHAHLLVSSFRPSALRSLRLDWPSLNPEHPHLSLFEIIGFAENPELPSHDLNYLAQAGLLAPPALPLSTYADLLGAERAATQILAMLWESCSQGLGHHVQLSLAESAHQLARPWREGLTRPTGPLGGGLPLYGFYRSQDGWLALAALEPEFVQTLRTATGLSDLSTQDLSRFFAAQPSSHWKTWAQEKDLPLTVINGR